MIKLTIISTIALAIAISGAVSAEISSSTVRFGPNDQYTGYLAKPSGDGPFPGLVVIHEWWGLNDNIRAESDKLAKAGYAALAVDLFGKSTTDPQEARKMTQNLDQQAATTQLIAAANYLRSLVYVPDDKVGSIGWCFGGKQSLLLAINDPKLATAVIYYGQPVTDPKELAKIKASVLGIFGEADESIPMSTVQKFRQALTEAGVRHEIYTYPGAGHAFANPTRGDSYKPAAAEDAWKKTLVFLDSKLCKPKS